MATQAIEQKPVAAEVGPFENAKISSKPPVILSVSGVFGMMCAGLVDDEDLKQGIFALSSAREGVIHYLDLEAPSVLTLYNRAYGKAKVIETYQKFVNAFLAAEAEGRAVCRTREEGSLTFDKLNDILAKNGLPQIPGDTHYNYPTVDDQLAAVGMRSLWSHARGLQTKRRVDPTIYLNVKGAIKMLCSGQIGNRDLENGLFAINTTRKTLLNYLGSKSTRETVHQLKDELGREDVEDAYRRFRHAFLIAERKGRAICNTAEAGKVTVGKVNTLLAANGFSRLEDPRVSGHKRMEEQLSKIGVKAVWK